MLKKLINKLPFMSDDFCVFSLIISIFGFLGVLFLVDIKDISINYSLIFVYNIPFTLFYKAVICEIKEVI